MSEWETRSVRAWNLKPGDVISFLDRKRMRDVKRTVDDIEPEGADQFIIRFRRWRTWGMLVKRTELICVRRMVKKNTKRKATK